MRSSKPSVFESPLAPYMAQFVREKRAVGYKYDAGVYLLTQFDRFLAHEAPNDETLTRTAARKWLAKRHLRAAPASSTASASCASLRCSSVVSATRPMCPIDRWRPSTTGRFHPAS